MTDKEALLRVNIQQMGGAVQRLGADNPPAAELLTALFRTVAEEAARTPRFAKALIEAAATAGSGDALIAAAPVRAPRVRSTSSRRAAAKREPGAFDPFEVYNASGADALRGRLAPLSVDQLRDIIAEQQIDTHKETGRKRKQEVLVDWAVGRVQELAEKGSVFR